MRWCMGVLSWWVIGDCLAFRGAAAFVCDPVKLGCIFLVAANPQSRVGQPQVFSLLSQVLAQSRDLISRQWV